MGPAAVLLLCALGANVQLDAGVRLEADARYSDPPAFPGEKRTVDLSATPRVGLQIGRGGTHLVAVYSPRLALLGVNGHKHPEVMHQGEARLQLVADASFRVEAFAEGAAGRTDLVSESRSAGTVSTGTTTALLTQHIDLERGRTGLQVFLVPERRTELQLAADVAQDGGADAASRAAYPVARALDASAALRWSATRLDRVSLELSGTEARITALDADSAWTEAIAVWRHQLAPRTEAWAGAGAVALWSRTPAPGTPPPPGRATHRGLEPAAQLGLSRGGEQLGLARSGERLGLARGERLEPSGELAGTLGAAIDRATGVAVQQGLVRGSLRWPWTSSVALLTRGSASLTWSSNGRTRTGQAELGLSFTLAPRLHLDLGGYGTRQRSTDPAVPNVTSYGGLVSLNLQAPPARF